MSGEVDEFEDEIGGMIGRLAEKAPAGPTAEDLRRRLRWRAIRRWGAGSVSAAALLAVVLVRMPSGVEQPRLSSRLPQPATGVRSPLADMNAPIPIDAEGIEIEVVLRAYASWAGISGTVHITKEPGEGLSFLVVGSSQTPPEEVSVTLAGMFQRFQTVDVRLSEHDLSYTLVADAQ